MGGKKNSCGAKMKLGPPVKYGKGEPEVSENFMGRLHIWGSNEKYF